MELSDSQKASVITWIQEGLSIADVQRKLREELEVSMTYMDVRFLIDDLDVAVVEEVEEVEEEDCEEAKPAEEAELVEDDGVFVDVDAVMRPGSLVSGTVKFGDGKSLGWQLSASGQLGLIPDEDDAEYRPSPEDLREFQAQLQEVLKQKGF